MLIIGLIGCVHGVANINDAEGNEMRKLSPATQLRQANEKIEQLEKQLKQANDYKEMYQRNNTDLNGELDQIHSFLDALPNSIPRELENYKKNNALTRIAAWMAARQAA